MTFVSTRRMLGAIAGLLIVAACTKSAALGNDARVWIIVATIVVSVAGADALALDRQLMPTRPIVPLTLAATALATYACVPETDQFRGVFVVVGLAIAADLLVSREPDDLSVAPVAALVLWAGVEGGVNRQSAFVGAFFAWWPVFLLPLVVLVRPLVKIAREEFAWAITAVGACAALVVARTGGTNDDLGPALVAVAAGATASFAVALVIASYATRVPGRPPADLSA